MSTAITSPDQIFREFVKRANAGDVDGLVALYREDAKVYFSPEKASNGHEEIRAAIVKMLEIRASLSDKGQRKTIIVGDLAMTSAFSAGKAFTAEVAQRQPDGTWLWLLDHPNFTAENYLAAG